MEEELYQSEDGKLYVYLLNAAGKYKVFIGEGGLLSEIAVRTVIQSEDGKGVYIETERGKFYQPHPDNLEDYPVFTHHRLKKVGLERYHITRDVYIEETEES